MSESDFEKQLEATRPAQGMTNEEYAEVDAPADANSVAMQHFGKPFGQLARRDQRMIMTVLHGSAVEARKQVESLRTNNLLDAQIRVNRMGERLAKVNELIDKATQSGYELVECDQETAEFEGKTLYKTKGGHEARKVRHIKRLLHICKAAVDIEKDIVKLSEHSGGSTFVKIDSKTANVNGPLRPEDVASQLGSIVQGEIVGDVGEPDQ